MIGWNRIYSLNSFVSGKDSASAIRAITGRLGLRLGTHETMLLDAAMPVHVVAARCGHDPAVLLRVYANRTKKADTTAANVNEEGKRPWWGVRTSNPGRAASRSLVGSTPTLFRPGRASGAAKGHDRNVGRLCVDGLGFVKPHG